MNKEYYQAKADLCRRSRVAIKQMVEGEAKEAGDNLIRMVNALNKLEHLKHKEEKGQCLRQTYEREILSYQGKWWRGR
jgi:hypothetical protein